MIPSWFRTGLQCKGSFLEAESDGVALVPQELKAAEGSHVSKDSSGPALLGGLGNVISLLWPLSRHLC